MADFIFSVSEVNGYVKRVLEAEDLLQNIKIRGEISNYSVSYAGHVYFTLKDELAAVQCVWFAGSAKGLQHSLKNGDKVNVVANVTLYIKGGTYQLVIRDVIKDGTGDLFEQFEKLKKQLEEEGLFDAEHKKALPEYPNVVGVITSETGAAIQDIIRVLDGSWGNVTMRLYPVSVQGDSAASQMIDALKYFDENKAADVLIIGRGGGSFEDLNCFNDERLVRQVYKCSIPIISAVGHENDFSLCDFAADVREATPSTAAKRAVANKKEEMEKLGSIKNAILGKINTVVEKAVNSVSNYNLRLSGLNPSNIIMQSQQEIDMLHIKMSSLMDNKLRSSQQEISSYFKHIETLNPKNTLKRGFAIIQDKKRNTLTDISAVKEAGSIIINMHDGDLSADIAED